jgi:HTH-like domain
MRRTPNDWHTIISSAARSRRPPDVELRTRRRDFANRRRRFGYRRLSILLREQGEPSGINRIYRIYREEGLTVRKRRARSRAIGTRTRSWSRLRPTHAGRSTSSTTNSPTLGNTASTNARAQPGSVRRRGGQPAARHHDSRGVSALMAAPQLFEHRRRARVPAPCLRQAHAGSLQEAQAGQGNEGFKRLLYERLDATLGEYLSALQEALPQPEPNRKPNPNDPTPRG